MQPKGNVDIGIGVDLMQIATGDVLRLKDGRLGTVVENMQDGQWVELQFPDAATGDELELIHSQEIDQLVPRSE
ncbi:hypothetical protein [Roseobacter sp. N2S]|uniref:hypothetical protein n=1 Tax=Roseobacter sp. N2S TaxID=2663844 RepID=UPI000DF3C9D7|nr:hypothetical protein [Roseobacter sp. N2S]MDR6267474.1 hypothetical protein [Roseobacter sp. N2S]